MSRTAHKVRLRYYIVYKSSPFVRASMETERRVCSFQMVRRRFTWSLGCVPRGMRRLLLNLLGVVCAFSCSYMVWMIALSQDSRSHVLLLDSRGHDGALTDQGPACHRPDMNINNELVTKHLKTLPKLKCSPEADWLTLSQGSVWADKGAVSRHGNFVCKLDMFRRLDDYRSEVYETVTFSSSDKLTALKADFFEAHCKAEDNQKWQNIMAGVHRNSSAPTREPAPGTEPKWNVLMFGFDSMSRLHFMRKMPKTYKFLTEEMGAVVLEGYNIVGDGTPQALIPILTGNTEQELPDTRKRNKNTDYVNVYPFVWKNFSAQNYVTAFAEDTPSVGIFTYRLNGFKEQPTDHYMRAFYVEAKKQFSKHKKMCLGSLPRHVVMLNWLRQLYEVYRDLPKFAFGFHGELSHDDFNLVGVSDDDVTDFVKGLRDADLLKDTFLIIMSDHGHRYSSMRTLAQGKQEERLPFFSIAPPESFRERHSLLFENLKINSQRVTSPFDLHPTFLSLLDIKSVPLVGDVTSRDISLFSRIPEERTCAQAGIEPHWCTCLAWESLPVDDATSKEAAQSVVDFINGLTSEQESKCARLTLDQVTRSERYQPNKALLGYKGVLDQDGFVPDLSDTVKTNRAIYSVQLQVHPSGGVYEASLTFDIKSKTFHVLQKDISRVNLYGTQPHCVQEELPHLMKYCFCKVQRTL